MQYQLRGSIQSAVVEHKWVVVCTSNIELRVPFRYTFFDDFPFAKVESSTFNSYVFASRD